MMTFIRRIRERLMEIEESLIRMELTEMERRKNALAGKKSRQRFRRSLKMVY